MYQPVLFLLQQWKRHRTPEYHGWFAAVEESVCLLVQQNRLAQQEQSGPLDGLGRVRYIGHYQKKE